MDDKTEELRDIFLSVSDSETVTERQEGGRGSLRSDEAVRADLRAAIERMGEDLGFETPLPVAALVTIVEQYYDGASDAEIAGEIDDALPDGVDPESAVARARLDLHIVREEDRDRPVSLDRLDELRAEDRSVDTLAAEFDASTDEIRFACAVLDTEHERRRVADRYREAFEDALQDRDLAERLTSSLEETGLEEATADQEVDVDM